jgi:predicted ATPase
MLEELQLQNVRVFADKLWRFRLRPLTIFCGTNSAGKSTLLKSILALSQTLVDKPLSSDNFLHLSGNQVDMGDYSTAISGEDTDLSLGIGITISDRLPRPVIHASFPEVVAPFDMLGQLEGYLPYDLEARFEFTKGVDNLQPRGVLSRGVFRLSSLGRQLLEFSVQRSPHPQGMSVYSLTLPMDFYARHMKEPRQPHFSAVDLATTSVPVILNGVLPQYVLIEIDQSPEAPSQPRYGYEPLPYLISGALRDLQSALGSIQYLGPLRAPAKRHYLVSTVSETETDPAGELLPYILKDMDQQAIAFVMPLRTEGVVAPLKDALNVWLYYFRTGLPPDDDQILDEIAIESYKHILVEFRLLSSADQLHHSLADSGFGYSQLLPILVRGLVSGPGTTLMIEQPEVHLNPALQVRLAAFLISLMHVGKQIIIETHSEHIVNAIRVFAAEEQGGQIAEKVGIFYLDSTKSERVFDLRVQSDGTVPAWPSGFFGEALDLSARLMKAQRRTPKVSGS